MMKAVLLATLFMFSSLEAASFKASRFSIHISNQHMKIKGSLLLTKNEKKEAFLGFLQKNLKQGEDLLITLDLFGGDLALVNKFYDKIRTKCSPRNCLITTEVEMFRTCASACIPLFMVGERRFAAERTNWGFHQAYVLGGFVMLPFMAEYVLKSKGVDPQWLRDHKYMFRTVRLTWLKPSDLYGSHIITDLIPHPR